MGANQKQNMAFKKENRPRPTFSKITIGLASPDTILERSYGEVLKPKQSTIVLTNPKEMVCFAKEFLDQLKTMNVPVVNINVSVIKESFAIVAVWK